MLFILLGLLCISFSFLAYLFKKPLCVQSRWIYSITIPNNVRVFNCRYSVAIPYNEHVERLVHQMDAEWLPFEKVWSHFELLSADQEPFIVLSLPDNLGTQISQQSGQSIQSPQQSIQNIQNIESIRQAALMQLASALFPKLQVKDQEKLSILMWQMTSGGSISDTITIRGQSPEVSNEFNQFEEHFGRLSFYQQLLKIKKYAQNIDLLYEDVSLLRATLKAITLKTTLDASGGVSRSEVTSH